jgi:FKBP-type peptidyl-prolyl cis-trans isomerase FkpA
MATRKSQRIFIWVIAAVMALGTLGAYFAVILQNNNEQDEVTKQQEFMKQYAEQMKANNAPLDGYQAEKFSVSDASTFKSEDLVTGEGAEATKDTNNTLSYFGWTPDGTIFDSSNKKDGSGKAFTFKPADGGAIEGWVQGVPGMKAGGVRKLTIPAELAYGAQGSQPLIEPNTPLVFIIKLDKVEK